MRVKIENYIKWIGPYEIAETLFFWTKTEDKNGFDTYPEWVDNFGEKLSKTWVNDICKWFHSKKKRKETVHIDKWDSYSADHTLSLIIVPVLEQLKETKQGAPMTNDVDVPEELRSTNAKPFDPEIGEVDEFHYERWDWILNEMIWAFTEIRSDNWEDQFHTGKADIQWKEFPEDSDGEQLYEILTGPKDTHKFDKDGYFKHAKRIQNGTTLFGKYYQSLWD